MSKLTADQRRRVFLRWIEGNRAYAAGGRPETMAELGKTFGVSASAVNQIIRTLGGDGNRRPGNRKRAFGECSKCSAPAKVKGLCYRCYRMHRYATDGGVRERQKATGRAYNPHRKRRYHEDSAYRDRVRALARAAHHRRKELRR